MQGLQNIVQSIATDSVLLAAKTSLTRATCVWVSAYGAQKAYDAWLQLRQAVTYTEAARSLKDVTVSVALSIAGVGCLALNEGISLFDFESAADEICSLMKQDPLCQSGDISIKCDGSLLTTSSLETACNFLTQEACSDKTTVFSCFNPNHAVPLDKSVYFVHP